MDKGNWKGASLCRNGCCQPPVQMQAIQEKKKGSQPRVGRREPGEHPIFILNLTSRAG